MEFFCCCDFGPPIPFPHPIVVARDLGGNVEPADEGAEVALVSGRLERQHPVLREVWKGYVSRSVDIIMQV